MTNDSAADRWLILDLVNRYFAAIDGRDFELLRRCFTDDVVAVYEGIQVADGIESLMTFFEGRSEHAPFVDIVDLRSSLHFIGNHTAEVGGDLAHAHTSALAHLLDAPGSQLRLRTRALRYVDELVRTESGWKIRRREHIFLWMKVEDVMSSAAEN